MNAKRDALLTVTQHLDLMLLVVGDGRSSPRLSGTLFAYVILCMMTLLPLVVAREAGAASALRRRVLKVGRLSLFQPL